MTPQDETTLAQTHASDAIDDILGWLQDCTPHQLSDAETDALALKIRYWFLAATRKGELAVRQSIERFVAESRNRLRNFPAEPAPQIDQLPDWPPMFWPANRTPPP